MSQDSRNIRFGLWYDFRNPPQWRQASDRLYRDILDQIAWGESNGFDDVWLSEHLFIDDGYLLKCGLEPGTCEGVIVLAPKGGVVSQLTPLGFQPDSR